MKQKLFVGIVMGSDSDLPVMAEVARILDAFSITYEITVLSAHRSPEKTRLYAKSALKRGVKVIIAGASGAAHLAGVVAAHFPLPVIGVPIASPPLSGLDSLYSTLQMPPGVPVATVSINGAQNAGLLAIEILATSDPLLAKKLVKYRKNLATKVGGKAKKLEKLGFERYLKEMEDKK